MFCPKCGKKVDEPVTICPKCGQALDQHRAIVKGIFVASLGARFANQLVDYIGYFISCFVLGFIVGIILVLSHNTYLIQGFSKGPYSLLLGLLVIILYFVFFEVIWQRTPGKWLTKTKVVMKDGSKPDFLHILGRTLARFIPFDNFSFLFTPIGWHDSLSGTMVVPAALTADEIKQIDPKNPGEKTSGLVKIILIIVAILFFVALAGIIASVILVGIHSTKTPVSTDPTEDFGNYTIMTGSDADTFTSKDLGIQFQFDGSTVAPKEVGNTITLYNDPDQPHITVFHKSPSSDLATAVKSQLLAKFPLCDIEDATDVPLVENENTEQVYLTPHLSKQETAQETANPEIGFHSERCPAGYTQIDSLNGFVSYSNHPDTFLFLEEGQETVPAKNNQDISSDINSLFDTIQLIN